jgi:predicted histone-like DNA-binding protein
MMFYIFVKYKTNNKNVSHHPNEPSKIISMAVKLKMVTKRNPRNVSEPAKYYGVAVSRGKINHRDLAELISSQSSMTEGDVLGVLKALELNIINILESGQSVELGELGTFSIGASTQGIELKEKFSIRQVTKRRVLFRPGYSFKRMLRRLRFSVR